MCKLTRLGKGHVRFLQTICEKQQQRFDALASAQSPDVVFIACSDSRVDPHRVTSSGPGELFVLRNAGNIVPDVNSTSNGEQASLEFAVNALNVSHVVVLGHSDCGAVKAMKDPETVETSFALHRWIKESGSLEQIRLLRDEPLSELVKLNVLQQLENLRSLPFIKEKVAAEELFIHGWYYDIASAGIECFDENEDVWTSLSSYIETGPWPAPGNNSSSTSTGQRNIQ